MYRLTRENLTHLGGPMGTEYTTTDWTKYFHVFNKALAFAQKDNNNESLGWCVAGKRKWRSQDCGSHMYHITEVQTEDPMPEFDE